MTTHASDTQHSMNHTQLAFALLEAAGTLQRRFDAALNFRGITFSEFRLLSLLEEIPPATATRVHVARALGLSASGVTRALKPLEKLGFVETQRNERDARQSLAALTDHGRELLDDTRSAVQRAAETTPGLCELSPDAHQQFVAALAPLQPSALA